MIITLVSDFIGVEFILFSVRPSGNCSPDCDPAARLAVDRAAAARPEIAQIGISSGISKTLEKGFNRRDYVSV